jgi:hypothetical protein
MSKPPQRPDANHGSVLVFVFTLFNQWLLQVPGGAPDPVKATGFGLPGF